MRAGAFKAKFGNLPKCIPHSAFIRFLEIKCTCGLLVPSPDAMCQRAGFWGGSEDGQGSGSISFPNTLLVGTKRLC